MLPLSGPGGVRQRRQQWEAHLQYHRLQRVASASLVVEEEEEEEEGAGEAGEAEAATSREAWV